LFPSKHMLCPCATITLSPWSLLCLLSLSTTPTPTPHPQVMALTDTKVHPGMRDTLRQLSQLLRAYVPYLILLQIPPLKKHPSIPLPPPPAPSLRTPPQVMALKDTKGHPSMRDTLRQLRQLLRAYVAEGHQVLLFVKPGTDPVKVHERLQDVMGDSCKVSSHSKGGGGPRGGQEERFWHARCQWVSGGKRGF
jgi:hypothetical protein